MAVQKSGMNLLRLPSELVLLRNGWNYGYLKSWTCRSLVGMVIFYFNLLKLGRNIIITIVELYTKVGPLVDVLSL